jgi:hypothetical protein
MPRVKPMGRSPYSREEERGCKASGTLDTLVGNVRSRKGRARQE